MNLVTKLVRVLSALGLLLFLTGIAVAQTVPAPPDLPSQLAGLAGSNPICLNVSDAVAANADKLFGALAVLMGILKVISWSLGHAGGKIEDSSSHPIVKGVGKATSVLAWLIGIFSIANVPASVRFQPKLLPFDKPPQG